MSGRFAALNRDKRSLCLDLKRPEGRAALLRLVRRYDVVVESFRPGVLDRLGVGWGALSTENPRLVLCSISGYGQDGPYRDRAGHDINYVSVAGVLGRNGARGGDPTAPGVQLADIAGGALWGAVGILAALVAARSTGKGAHVDVSMCEGALAFLLPELGNLDLAGAPPPRGGGLLDGGAACYGVYRTRDGRHLSVGALEPKFWLAFNAAIGRPGDVNELAAPPETQARVREEVQAILAQRTRDEWEQVFAAADACVEPVLELDELSRHPQHAARGLFFRLGDLAQARTPLAPRERASEHAPPPRLGEHTSAILADAGFAPDEVAALQQAGVARQA